MGSSREERVMQRAYEIWEQEGRPEGRQEEHWRRAEEEISRHGNGPKEQDRGAAPTTSDAPATSSVPSP